MSNEFEWQTEVEGGWEPAVPEPKTPRRRMSRRTKLVILISCLSLPVVAGFLVFGLVRDRVLDATITAESGVSLAHRLVIRAVLDGDRDLVESVIADRPASWRALNRDLVGGDLFFSRRPLGIEVTGDTEEQTSSEFVIQLSPELDSADIVDRRPYSVISAPGMTETVVLERTFHYVLNDGQWSLAPVADERQFWGNWVRDERSNITLTYPERDEPVAIKLSGYLDSILPQLCAVDGITCPDAFHLEFKLDTDPTVVRRLGEGLLAIRTGSATAADRLVLPAPTLVGVPVDEAGYEALRRGYAGWIAAAIAAGYGSANISPPDVLAQFDLQLPPAPKQPLPLTSLSTFPSGMAVPDQDVLMLCSNTGALRLLRFRTSDGRWLEEAPDTTWQRDGDQPVGRPNQFQSYLSRLPDYSSAVVQTSTRVGNDTLWRSFLWRDGMAQLLTEERHPHYYLPPRMQRPDQPSNGNLAYFVPADDEGDQQFTSLKLDLNQCDSTPCASEELPGMPIWSPDGQRALLIVPEPEHGNVLKLADANGRTLGQIGLGQSAAWLDDDRFVYIERQPSSERDDIGREFGQKVMLVVIDEHDPADFDVRQLFDAEMIRLAIPASLRPSTMAMWSAQPALQGDTWWFVAGIGLDGGRQQDYVLVYNALSQETRLVAPLGDFRLVELPFLNSSGEQAVITGLLTDGSEVSVELIDAGSGEIRRLPNRVPLDWSADGQWLLQSDNDSLYLVPATVEQSWPVNHDLPGCYWSVWIEKNSGQSDQ